MENRERQTGVARAQTEPIETLYSTDEAVKKGNALSVGESNERKASSQTREIAPQLSSPKQSLPGWGELVAKELEQEETNLARHKSMAP